MSLEEKNPSNMKSLNSNRHGIHSAFLVPMKQAKDMKCDSIAGCIFNNEHDSVVLPTRRTSA